MTLRLHPEAEADLREAADYYRKQADSGVATSFLAESERTLGVIESRPLIGAAVAGGFRRLPMRRFPFSVFYEVVSGDVRVLAIAHHRRKPGYWHQRLMPAK